MEPKEMGIAERVRHHQGAVAKAPEDAESHYRLGNALFDMGRNQDAYRAYQRAIQLNPDYADAYANMGLVLRKMGNMKAAIGAYARALDIDPTDETTLNNMAIVAELTEDWKRVRWCYEKMYALAPTNLDYVGAYATVLYGLGDYEAAIPVYGRLIAANQETAANTYRLGFCYYSLDRWAEASEIWESARKLTPDDPPINRGLVAVYVSLGDAASARAAAERCRALGIALKPALQEELNVLLR